MSNVGPGAPGEAATSFKMGKLRKEASVMVNHCIMPDCDGHGGVYRQDGEAVSLDRVREIVMSNGWLNIMPGRWLCPHCTAKMAKHMGTTDPEKIAGAMREGINRYHQDRHGGQRLASKTQKFQVG
jgi:hypothetical protein